MRTPADDERRRFLRQAMASGLVLAGGSLLAPLVHALGGQVPRELPPGKSVYDIRGSVRIDGRQASRDTQVRADSLVETGSNSFVIFRVGKDAHLVRENSRLQLSGSDTLADGLRLLTGQLLSVFGARQQAERSYSLSTTTATVGIRGTGVYAEAHADRSYVCTCYGAVELQSAIDTAAREQVVSVHHDAPRWILREPEGGRLIVPAPMINHTDEELMLVEAIVGRTPPFSSVKSYSAPRRGY